MGIELNIDEELATICVAATEMVSINHIIKAEIKNQDFMQRYSKMTDELGKCFDVLSQHLSSFSEINSETVFIDKFDELYTVYSNCYLADVSKPRAFSDEAYEHYLVLQTFRECNTQFPLLKRTFERLEKFVDKWVTNDAWLAMSIDNLLKRLQRLLSEVAGIKQKDPSDAFFILHSALNDFDDFMQLIVKKRDQLRSKPVMVSPKEYQIL